MKTEELMLKVLSAAMKQLRKNCNKPSVSEMEEVYTIGRLVLTSFNSDVKKLAGRIHKEYNTVDKFNAPIVYRKDNPIFSREARVQISLGVLSNTECTILL